MAKTNVCKASVDNASKTVKKFLASSKNILVKPLIYYTLIILLIAVEGALTYSPLVAAQSIDPGILMFTTVFVSAMLNIPMIFASRFTYDLVKPDDKTTVKSKGFRIVGIILVFFVFVAVEYGISNMKYRFMSAPTTQATSFKQYEVAESESDGSFINNVVLSVTSSVFCFLLGYAKEEADDKDKQIKRLIANNNIGAETETLLTKAKHEYEAVNAQAIISRDKQRRAIQKQLTKADLFMQKAILISSIARKDDPDMITISYFNSELSKELSLFEESLNEHTSASDFRDGIQYEYVPDEDYNEDYNEDYPEPF